MQATPHYHYFSMANEVEQGSQYFFNGDMEDPTYYHIEVEVDLSTDTDMMRITDSVGRMVPIDLQDLDVFIECLEEIREARQKRDVLLSELNSIMNPQD